MLIKKCNATVDRMFHMKTTFLTMIVWFILLKKNLVETVSEKYGINVRWVCEKSNDIIFHIKK